MICRSCGNPNPRVSNFCYSVQAHPSPANDPLRPAQAISYRIAPMSDDSPNMRSEAMLPSWLRAAVISGLAGAAGLGVARLVILQWNYSANERERQVQSMIVAEKLVKRGLLITAIRPSSRADRCGLRARDIIVRYGEASVEDITSYVTAAEQQSSAQR